MREINNNRQLESFNHVRWAPLVSRSAFRVATVALSLCVLAAIQLFFFAANTSVVHANMSTDFVQCADENPTPGVCDWIVSILNRNNSQYTEGRGVPQRLIFDAIAPTAGNMHTLTFSVLWSKGGIHAYDWLMSYDQAKVTAAFYNRPFSSNFDANVCGTANSLPAVCNALTGTIPFDVVVPNDPYISKDGATQDRIDGFVAQYGTRTIRMFGNSSISAATLSLAHDVAPGADTGDSYVDYTLAWTSSSTSIMIEMAGHLAVTAFDAVDPIAWGVPLGASNISGGPYHFKLNGFDGSNFGNQDNQIQNGGVVGPALMSTQRTSPGTVNVGQGVFDTAFLTGTAGPLNGIVTFYVCSDNYAPYTDTIQPSAGCSLTATVNPPQFNRVPLSPTVPVVLGGNNTQATGTAVSPLFTPTLNGFYCFTAVYSPTTINYLRFTDMVSTTNECFFVQSPTAVTLTDFSARAGEPWLPLALSAAGIVILATLAVAFAKRQS